MDFARKQLEKYGWTDGKGLGKHENGISQALRPKIKRSVTGVGHDPASEFNEHWWSQLYDKAAKNVEVEEKNGKTKKIKTIDNNEFNITNNTWRLHKKKNSKTENKEYKEYFVRTTILSGGSKTEDVKSGSESETEERKDVFQMTDEELFKACEGRTAHKGARHGLKATGKLARIQEQEAMLLALPKYEGYSHAKRLKQQNGGEEVVEQTSLDSQEENVKLKKKKRCLSQNLDEKETQPKPIIDDDKNAMEVDCDTSKIDDTVHGSNVSENKKAKKKKKRKFDNEIVENVSANQVLDEIPTKKKKNKKKLKDESVD